ncbi:hypothetical protein CEXT_4911 [Caerostris extrusa]|uniref:Uncharacterized protein n=1 Tax=Caerostris extrusa TaxID=172846 RepID=A0AAV4N7E9_CAEEX|nr:hypothetical protein CEXT_4911 [Caerostris extrusa]
MLEMAKSKYILFPTEEIISPPFPEDKCYRFALFFEIQFAYAFRERHTIKDVPKQRQLLIPESMSLLMRLPNSFAVVKLLTTAFAE